MDVLARRNPAEARLRGYTVKNDKRHILFHENQCQAHGRHRPAVGIPLTDESSARAHMPGPRAPHWGQPVYVLAVWMGDHSRLATPGSSPGGRWIECSDNVVAGIMTIGRRRGAGSEWQINPPLGRFESNRSPAINNRSHLPECIARRCERLCDSDSLACAHRRRSHPDQDAHPPCVRC